MDERSFDDFIKQKIGSYEDPTFDEGAFVTFNNSYAGFQRVSWFKTYRTEAVVVTALILFSLLNYFITSQVVQRHDQVNFIADTRHQSAVIESDSVFRLIHHLKIQNENLNDQIVQLHEKMNKQYVDQQRLKILVRGYQEGAAAFAISRDAADLDGTTNNPVVDDVNVNQTVLSRRERMFFQADKPVVVYLPTTVSTPPTPKADIHQKNISAKILNDLERHYFAGIGINVAPHIEGLVNVYNDASPQLTNCIGLLSDWVVSPRLSIVAGIDYMTTHNVVHDDYNQWKLPPQPSDLGQLRRAAIDTRTLSIPLALRYRHWVSTKSQFIAQAGYTPYVALRERKTLSYSKTNGGMYDHDDGTFDKRYCENVGRFYGGTAKVSLGVQRSVKIKQTLETSLFYERSLGAMNNVGHSLQLYGINLSYWYNLR